MRRGVAATTGQSVIINAVACEPGMALSYDSGDISGSAVMDAGK